MGRDVPRLKKTVFNSDSQTNFSPTLETVVVSG